MSGVTGMSVEQGLFLLTGVLSFFVLKNWLRSRRNERDMNMLIELMHRHFDLRLKTGQSPDGKLQYESTTDSSGTSS